MAERLPCVHVVRCASHFKIKGFIQSWSCINDMHAKDPETTGLHVSNTPRSIHWLWVPIVIDLSICTQNNMVYHTSRSHDSTPCAWTGNCSAIDITNVIATRNIEARWQMWRGRRITRRRSWRSCWWYTTWVCEVVKSVAWALTWLVIYGHWHDLWGLFPEEPLQCITCT